MSGKDDGRAGVAQPAVSPGHPHYHVPLVVTWMEGGEKGDCKPEDSSEPEGKGKKSKGGKRYHEKKLWCFGVNLFGSGIYHFYGADSRFCTEKNGNHAHKTSCGRETG